MANDVVNVIKVTENVEEFKKAFINENGIVDFNLVIPRNKDLDITSSSYAYYNTNDKAEYFSAYYNKVDNFKGTVAYVSTMVQVKIQLILENLYKETDTQQEYVDKVLDETIDNPYFVVEDDELQEIVNNGHALVSIIEEKARGYYNTQKYGYPNWYEWSIENWGTKWNAYSDSVIISEHDNEFYVEFETAWGTPVPVFVELYKKGFTFSVAYADRDDIGNTLGTIDYTKEGINDNFFIDLSYEERFYLALKVCGYDMSIDEVKENYNVDLPPVERLEEIDEMIRERLM